MVHQVENKRNFANFCEAIMSDEKFYSTFRDSVIGRDNIPEDDDTKSHRVTFLLHQLNMIPSGQRDLFWNIMRGYPTSPIYSFLCIGMAPQHTYTWVRAY